MAKYSQNAQTKGWTTHATIIYAKIMKKRAENCSAKDT